MKTLIAFVVAVIALISFPVMIWGIIHLNVIGFYAMLAFGLSFSIGICLGVSDDEEGSIINHGGSDGFD